MGSDSNDRNYEIYLKRLAGSKLKDIAQEYSISTARAQQIAKKIERQKSLDDRKSEALIKLKKQLGIASFGD